ncbi:MAG TPA: response regulator [Bryobacteraceae bacterium]|jgi:CheY-like chemotaxis protein|nr:response regulator [Bryobacteraceae bacterium]
MPPESRESYRLKILVIENDPAAARLIKEAFKEAGLLNVVTTVPDGDEALAYLRREERYSSHPRPDMIFLDLHLPKKSGLQVLKELKSNERLKATPVVVISGSAEPGEVQAAYELHASCYVRKPNDLGEFLIFVQCCYDFWGSQVVFPQDGHLEPATAAR